MSEMRYWLWLAAKTDVRPLTKMRLIEKCGDPKAIYFSARNEYEKLGVTSQRERSMLEDKSLDSADGIFRACEENNITILTIQDAAYPKRLARIYDPPAVLFIRGKLPLIDDEMVVSVAGTRRASEYGLRMAYALGRDIALCGGIVVSGLTAGIDKTAARGAKDAGGRCISVLGTAIDDVERGSFRSVSEGCDVLISEYPPGTKTMPAFFRARNRLTAGLSIASLIVEAPDKSGALLFAEEALAQGKEVYVLTANADSYTSAGSNALIKDGATPITCAWDILCGYESTFSGKLSDQSEKRAENNAAGKSANNYVSEKSEQSNSGDKKEKEIDKTDDRAYIDLRKQLSELTERQLKIVSVMDRKSLHIDDIISKLSYKAAEVASELTLMQIEGYIIREPGNRFSLNIKQK